MEARRQSHFFAAGDGDQRRSLSVSADRVRTMPSRMRAGWYWPLIAFAAVVVIASTPDRSTLFAPIADWSGYRKDFTAFYAASSMIASGSGGAIYHTDSIAAYETQLAGHPVGDYGYMAYFNPPAFAVALTPLTLLSFERAFQVWTALNIALLAIDVWMIWRIAAALPRRTKLLLSLGFVTFLPVVDGLLLGQFSLILVTAWMGAYMLLRAGRDGWAGAGRDGWAGAALTPLLVKPEILAPLLLLLFLKRRWRVFMGFVPIAAAVAVLSVVVVGLAEALRYPTYVVSSTSWESNATKSNAMFNWNGIVAMHWGQPSTVLAATSVLVGLSVLSLAAACYFWRGKLDPRSRQFAAQWMILTVVTVLVDPQLHLQDTVLLALPAVALYADASREDRATLGWIFAFAWVIIALGPIPNEQLHVNLFALYVVAASAVIVWRLHIRSHGRGRTGRLRLAAVAAS